MRHTSVVVHLSRDLPADYLTDIRDGMIVSVLDLDVLPDHPTRPVIALPTGRFVERSGIRFPIYELHPLGPAQRP